MAVDLPLNASEGELPLRCQRSRPWRLADDHSRQQVRRRFGEPTLRSIALEQAVRWRLVPVNVAGLVDPPRPLRRDMTALAPDQVRQLLAAAEGDRLGALYVLAVTAGFRQGELLALRWADVDVYHGWLKVVGSLARARGWGWSVTGPNTARSRRRLR